ncbi:MAG: sugar nucleotide-binding protein [Ferruginibacter sp.]|nr:sugar nucleotide-binding protein [Ferruginibacter sp.]
MYPAIWGGVECTINRRHNVFKDQLHLSNHYERKDDLEAFAQLGIKAIRYPVLWEKHCADQNGVIDWTWADQQLTTLRELQVEPIVGLIHHGSGPAFTSLLDDKFPIKLAAYAKEVATRFPWVEYYTPVNEPLTTARFSGLYGFWYPHSKNEHDFLTMLLNQVEAIVLSMRAIREINPAAKLVQTEDIGKTHSTPLLAYQADFENSRRWLTYDLLCGKVTPDHPLWNYFIVNGIEKARLDFFSENLCLPDIAGFNYYVTSERYLDEKVENFPTCVRGSNHFHEYADIDAARAIRPAGIGKILTEAWNRYHLPMAITEAHLHCSREDQLRWFKEIWDNCCNLVKKGINIKAVTAWSLLGAYDWNSLLVQDAGMYETGVFDLTTHSRRPTAMVKLIRSLSTEGEFNHPLLTNKGWWYRHNPAIKREMNVLSALNTPPLLIIGSGTLGSAFTKVCEDRGISYKILARPDIDITDQASVEYVMNIYKPWAVINAAGYVKVDDAESAIAECFAVNAKAPALLAAECKRYGIPFMTFSSDMVFNGIKRSPYMESDKMVPINIYGKSKAEGEAGVVAAYPEALIIRTSAFFGPWDKNNFVYNVINSLQQKNSYKAVNDVIVSPTYVPDLVNASLDLLIDEANGIWHLSNTGSVTWADFAQEIAQRSGYSKNKIVSKMAAEMSWKAQRPFYSVLESEKGIKLPCLDNAMDRFFLSKSN